MRQGAGGVPDRSPVTSDALPRIRRGGEGPRSASRRAVIERRVHPDREPECARAPQRDTEEDRDHEGPERTEQVFAAVSQVQRGERQRKHYRRRPEADPGCERGLCVPSERELLGQCGAHEYREPYHRVREHRRSRERDGLDAIPMQHGTSPIVAETMAKPQTTPSQKSRPNAARSGRP